MFVPDRAGAPVRPLHATRLSGPLSAALALCLAACTTPPATSTDSGDGDGAGGDPGGSSAADASVAPPGGDETVEVTLHPGPLAPLGTPALVTFGAPFPPGALDDGSRIAVEGPDGDVLASHAEALLPWRVWPGRGATESVRAALITVEVTFAEREPMVIRLRPGLEPERTVAPPADPREGWVPVTDGEYPAGTVREPAVYASFTADWLSRCALRHVTVPVGGDPAFAWWDEALLGYARTAVNDVPSSVTELMPYTTEYSPWLFDRSATLFNVYARTGDVKWLRHAHRAAQFYQGKVDPSGFFSLKGVQDLKYSYGRSLLTDFMFTGDPTLLDTIDRVGAAGRGWDPVYTANRSFWTERHQTYALLAALTAWEATGEERHAERAGTIARVSFEMAADPLGSWPTDGCMLHGQGSGGPICSPWMTALFADAAWQYYQQSGDPATLTFLEGLGHYARDHAIYPGGDGLDYDMPYYLASSVRKVSGGGPWSDIEHTCDVAGLVARGAWARKALGRDHTSLRDTAASLLAGCERILDHWHRPGAAGKAEWRLSPARKFSWWFGTTGDLPWLMSQLD